MISANRGKLCRSAWLATTIESICFDCKNKAISVVFEQAEIEDDYEAELPDKHFARYAAFI